MMSEEERKKIANRIRYSGKPNIMIAGLYWDIIVRDKPEVKEPTDAKD